MSNQYEVPDTFTDGHRGTCLIEDWYKHFIFEYITCGADADFDHEVASVRLELEDGKGWTLIGQFIEPQDQNGHDTYKRVTLFYGPPSIGMRYRAVEITYDTEQEEGVWRRLVPGDHVFQGEGGNTDE